MLKVRQNITLKNKNIWRKSWLSLFWVGLTDDTKVFVSGFIWRIWSSLARQESTEWINTAVNDEYKNSYKNYGKSQMQTDNWKMHGCPQNMSIISLDESFWSKTLLHTITEHSSRVKNNVSIFFKLLFRYRRVFCTSPRYENITGHGLIFVCCEHRNHSNSN